MSDLDTFRQDIKREELAKHLAKGLSYEEAAVAMAAPLSDIFEMALESETIALVELHAPDVAAELKKDAQTDDPLEIIERGMARAARKLVSDATGTDSSPSARKQLIELGLKLRAARSETPAKLDIHLPQTHVEPLIDACNEFNDLLRRLVNADSGSRVDGIS